MRYTTNNTSHAKLTTKNVQQVRALAAAGFTAKSIAPLFDICQREVLNILKGRAWKFLPVESVPLPTFSLERSTQLKHRRLARLTATQELELRRYRLRLAEQIENQSEREAFAIRLLNDWRVRKPKSKRMVKRLSEVSI